MIVGTSDRSVSVTRTSDTRTLRVLLSGHSASGRFVLTGVADGQPQWRCLADGEEADHRDGVELEVEWLEALRSALTEPGPDRRPGPGHTVDEIAALRADLEEWRAEVAAFVTVDRERVDRLLDGISCRP